MLIPTKIPITRVEATGHMVHIPRNHSENKTVGNPIEVEPTRPWQRADSIREDEPQERFPNQVDEPDKREWCETRQGTHQYLAASNKADDA
jgi:hypothetical protein